MSQLPQDRLYTRDDLWLRADGQGLYTLGVTDFGQNELGELVYIELPAQGVVVQRGLTLAVVESVKSVSEVRAPADCRVIQINARVGERPELVNESPNDEGWITQLRIETPPDDLLSPAQYAAWRRLDLS